MKLTKHDQFKHGQRVKCVFEEADRWLTFEEAEESGLKIKDQINEEVTEVTLDEVAKALGKDVSKIRIKKED